MEKELFRIVIPYTVEVGGILKDLTNRMIEYLQSEHAQELSRICNVAIEDEIYYKDAKNMEFADLAKINPLHILAHGYFGEIRKDGVEFICDDLSSPDRGIILSTIRFAYPIINKESKKIHMVHIIAESCVNRGI